MSPLVIVLGESSSRLAFSYLKSFFWFRFPDFQFDFLFLFLTKFQFCEFYLHSPLVCIKTILLTVCQFVLSNSNSSSNNQSNNIYANNVTTTNNMSDNLVTNNNPNLGNSWRTSSNNTTTTTIIPSGVESTSSTQKRGAERLFQYMEADGSDPEDYTR